MKNCTTTNLYESLEYCKGEASLPGIRPELYGISKKQIVGYPKLPAIDSKDATMESIATYAGDFTLAADSKFIKIDIDDAQSSAKGESQGSGFSKTSLNTLSFKYPGTNEAATGFCRLANNDDMIFVFRQRDGKFRVLGNESFRTDVKPTQESGAAVTDASGTTVEATTTDVCPCPFYVGKLVTEEGTIDCSTGELTQAGAVEGA